MSAPLPAETQLIAEQAIKIAALEKQVADYQERMKAIKMECICIGGPLNDNKLGYTRVQMMPFSRILAQAED